MNMSWKRTKNLKTNCMCVFLINEVFENQNATLGIWHKVVTVKMPTKCERYSHYGASPAVPLMFLKVHMYTANQTQLSTYKWNILTVNSGLLDLKTAVFYCSLKIKQSQAITGLKKRKSHRKDPLLIAFCYGYCISVFIGHLLPELFFSLWLSSCDPDLWTSWFLLVEICFLSLWYHLRNILSMANKV